jgi:hypothetical protein
MNLRVLIALAIIAILATAAYGFAASNSVPATTAGDGAAGITGYNVTNVHYNLNAANPANIDSVSFDLGTVANTVSVQMDGSTTWFSSCTAAGTVWTCLTPGETAYNASNLRVVAAQ